MAEKNYPKEMTIGGEKFTLRFMERKDRDSMIGFTSKMNEADLWFMRRDITKPEAIDDWIHEIETDRAKTLLVEHNDQIVGYGTIYYNQLFWNRHIAEMRVMVSSAYRGRGLGQKLARELTQLAKDMGLEKVMVHMAADDKAAQRMVDYLDFKPAAILADWIKTRDDRTHDLLIMSTDLKELNS
ncbi:MAG: hypothetical protein Kow00117_19300 [Phototrophicales bacterium]